MLTTIGKCRSRCSHVSLHRPFVTLLNIVLCLPCTAIFDNCVSVGLKFPVTRALHLREYSNGHYRLLPYYFATVTSSLILSSIYQFMQAIIVFFLVGLDFTPFKFFLYLLLLSLAASLGAFLGFIVGTYTSDLKRTQEILTPLLMPMIIFSGYMLPLPQIAVYLRYVCVHRAHEMSISSPDLLPHATPSSTQPHRPVYYISFYQYIFSALVINHFSDLKFTCSAVNVACMTRGEDYLEMLGLDASELGRDFGVILAFLVLLIVIGYISLKRVSI